MQAILFIVSVFTVTWGLAFLWPLGQPDSLWAFLKNFLPGVWAPTAIALLIMLFTGGVRGVRMEVAARFRYKPGSLPWLLVAVAVPAAAMSIAVFMARATGHAAPFTPSAAVPTMIGLQVITGAVGEELGWRGFLLPRLGQRFGTAAAAWTMGVLWAAWHIPAWFNPNLPHPTMPFVTTMVCTACLGVFLAFVFNRCGESVMATMLAHLSFNIATGFGGAQLSAHVLWLTLAGIFGVLALMATVQMRSEERRSASSRGGFKDVP